MEELPDDIVQHILSLTSNAKDVASCTCVSKRWKYSMPFLRSLFFPRNAFDNLRNGETADTVVGRMIGLIEKLEDLVVYCPFTGTSLALWLSKAGPSLRNLDLRLDNIIHEVPVNEPSKLDCIGAAYNLESLKLWGVFMLRRPKWDAFRRLKNLEIVGARIEENALQDALHACPNLTRLLLLSCEGAECITIANPHLEQCKLDFYGPGSTLLTIDSPKLELLDVTGCGLIRVPDAPFLKTLSISNSSGRVYHVEFGKLAGLETLTLRGLQWSWDALSYMLDMACEVKHLFMKVEFASDSIGSLLSFPEIDFVNFFNCHPKLQTFHMHGAMFAALCQKNSLKYFDSEFSIPCLERVVITVRSPLNAEQKMATLESLVKCAKNMKKMTIKILQMKSCLRIADDLFDDICRFTYMNRRIVSIE